MPPRRKRPAAIAQAPSPPARPLRASAHRVLLPTFAAVQLVVLATACRREPAHDRGAHAAEIHADPEEKPPPARVAPPPPPTTQGDPGEADRNALAEPPSIAVPVVASVSATPTPKPYPRTAGRRPDVTPPAVAPGPPPRIMGTAPAVAFPPTPPPATSAVAPAPTAVPCPGGAPSAAPAVPDLVEP